MSAEGAAQSNADDLDASYEVSGWPGLKGSSRLSQPRPHGRGY
jgi:hypothetical protein